MFLNKVGFRREDRKESLKNCFQAARRGRQQGAQQLCHLLLCQPLLKYELPYQFSYCCVIDSPITAHWLMRKDGQCMIHFLL